MDFSWMPYFNGFWIFPLLCVLFMAIMMMIGRGGMCFRRGHRAPTPSDRESARQILDRRYASGEIGKEQYDAMQRDLNAAKIPA